MEYFYRRRDFCRDEYRTDRTPVRLIPEISRGRQINSTTKLDGTLKSEVVLRVNDCDQRVEDCQEGGEGDVPEAECRMVHALLSKLWAKISMVARIQESAAAL